MSLLAEFFFSVQIWSNRDSVEIKLGRLKLAVFTITVYYPLAQQSCGGDIGSVPYVCM